MGRNVTENYSDQVINSTMDVINSNTALCRSSISQDQLLNVVATGPGSVVDIGDVRWRQAVAINSECYQTALNSTNLEANISQRAMQEAEAIGQALSVTSTVARNINDSVMNLSQSVINATRQECGDLSRQAQAASIRAEDGGRVNVATLDWSQTFDGVITCVQNTRSVTDAKTQLEQVLAQEGVAETQDTFGRLGIIIAIVVVVIIIIIAVVVIYAGPSIAKAGVGAAAASAGLPGGGGVAAAGLMGM